MRAARPIALLLVAVLAGAPLPAQAGHSDPARFLRSFVHLTITDAHGDTAGPSSVPIRAVDVNGAVRVTFDPRALTAYLPAAAVAVGGDTTGRRLIMQLLDDLAAYGRLAAELAQSVSQGSAAFDSARARASAWYGSYRRHVVEFFQHQVALQDSSPVDLDVRAARAAEPFMGRDQMGEFTRYLQSEFVRLLREAERDETSQVGMLSLVAWRLTPAGDSVRVGLLGYDTTTAQRATFVSKITTVMSAQENASYAFHQHLAAKVQNVDQLFKTAFGEYRAAAADARAAVMEMAAAIEQSGEAVRTLIRQPDALVNAVPDSAKAAARQVVADVRAVADWLSGILVPIRALREDIRTVVAGEQSPLVLLSTVSMALDTVAAAGGRVRRLEPLVQALTSHLKELGLQLPSVEDLALPDTVLTALTAATAAYGRLQAIVRRARELLPHGHNVERVAAAFNEGWIPRLSLTPRALASAPETEILLAKAGGDRTDGDLLVLRADLLNPDRTPAGTYEWTLRIEKLDLSSRFAAGVGFAGRALARRNPDESLRPIPVLAWVLRHRTRGESGLGRFWNFVDVSPGMHIVTLGGDTQAVQFGIGVSVNLLQDFAQLGLGRNLQPESADDRYYWYFGLGLFKLVRLGQ